MSTTRSRSRSGGRSYTARLQQRAAAPVPVPARELPAWLGVRWLPAALAVAGEVGHLAAGYVEWPAGSARGLFHVVVAGALGLLAVAVYFGRSRPVLVAGAVGGAALVAAWPVGALVGWSPYRDFPVVASIALSVVVAVGTAVFLAQWADRS